MKATIGNNLLSKIKLKDKPYDIRDDKLSGFLLRVNISGKLLYMCEYARGKRVTIGKADAITPAQARDLAKQILADVIKGIDPKATKKKSMNLNLHSFIENEYKPWVEAHRKSAIKTIGRIRRSFSKPFGNKSLLEITPILIDQWRTQKFKEGLSVETVNRDVATFKAALSKAVEWGFIDIHPLAKLKLFKTDTSAKIRYLNEEEEVSLRRAIELRDEKIKIERANANEWRKKRGYPLMLDLGQQHFADYMTPMILISLNTGLRQGELFNIEWSDINFDRRVLTVRGGIAKSGKTRHVPLNEEAFDALKSWHNQTSKQGLIFQSFDGSRFNNVRKAWLNLLKDAQIQNFRWHDMRHHFASRLVMAGVDLNTVRELLGHSDIKMTLRYAHLAPEHKAEAVARLLKMHHQKSSDNNTTPANVPFSAAI